MTNDEFNNRMKHDAAGGTGVAKCSKCKTDVSYDVIQGINVDRRFDDSGIYHVVVCNVCRNEFVPRK